MILVATVTFGHLSADVAKALQPAVAYGKSRHDVRVVVVDDQSGAPPRVQDVETLETPERMGFAGAVNFLLEKFRDTERIVLINPDVSLSLNTIEALATSGAAVAVPRIARAGHLENVRGVESAWRHLALLLCGEWLANRGVAPVAEAGGGFEAPPFAPSGAVVSVHAGALRAVPLDPDFFWLEFSDWVQRYASVRGPIRIAVVPHDAGHVGASTSVSYPISVAASQARARAHYVRRYGSPILRFLVPLAVLSRAMRFAARQRSIRAGVAVFHAALDRTRWQDLR